MNDDTVLKIVGVLGVTALGVAYFIIVRKDGTVLFTLSSIIGGIIGYSAGKHAQ